MSYLSYQDVLTDRKEYFITNSSYVLVPYKMYDYKHLHQVPYRKKRGKSKVTYNDVIIMADTETSKSIENTTYIDKKGCLKYNPVHNYVVAWTISIRSCGVNIVTLYGNKPSEFIECIKYILNSFEGHNTYVYFHNLSYDWVFLRKYLIKEFGAPVNQLNTKPFYPINIEFENGLIIKDSYILAQKSLEKWANDLDVEHKKAIGLWDYNKIRNQDYKFNNDELEYIEHDTLAGVECIDKLLHVIKKDISTVPLTATGIIRDDIRKIGAKNRAHDKYLRYALSYNNYLKCVQAFHGGYVHGNRHFIDYLLDILIQAYDKTSSYPYQMLSKKFPMGFTDLKDNKNKDYILKYMDDYAFLFKLILIKPKIKQGFNMPVLQFSKCVKSINAITDNGRVLAADYVEIYITEQDLYLINQQYEFESHVCTDISYSRKEYLPRWFTDYIFDLFTEKCNLALRKKEDPANYSIIKGKINGCYGMTVQKVLRDNIIEDYSTGEFNIENKITPEEYEKVIQNRNMILSYQWGVWVTAYALRDLFDLGECAEEWYYSDTDSCYGASWDESKLKSYNEKMLAALHDNNYDSVTVEGHTYTLGIAELDDTYSEYKYLGAKRYCGRSTEDNELHITVAGVPKRGAACLNNDINNFASGFIFDGISTGKLTHHYMIVEDTYIDENGNEVGDSVDLTPADYQLSKADIMDFDALEEVIYLQTYEEGLNRI